MCAAVGAKNKTGTEGTLGLGPRPFESSCGQTSSSGKTVQAERVIADRLPIPLNHHHRCPRGDSRFGIGNVFKPNSCSEERSRTGSDEGVGPVGVFSGEEHQGYGLCQPSRRVESANPDLARREVRKGTGRDQPDCEGA